MLLNLQAVVVKSVPERGWGFAEKQNGDTVMLRLANAIVYEFCPHTGQMKTSKPRFGEARIPDVGEVVVFKTTIGAERSGSYPQAIEWCPKWYHEENLGVFAENQKREREVQKRLRQVRELKSLFQARSGRPARGKPLCLDHFHKGVVAEIIDDSRFVASVQDAGNQAVRLKREDGVCAYLRGAMPWISTGMKKTAGNLLERVRLPMPSLGDELLIGPIDASYDEASEKAVAGASIWLLAKQAQSVCDGAPQAALSLAKLAEKKAEEDQKRRQAIADSQRKRSSGGKGNKKKTASAK